MAKFVFNPTLDRLLTLVASAKMGNTKTAARALAEVLEDENLSDDLDALDDLQDEAFDALQENSEPVDVELDAGEDEDHEEPDGDEDGEDTDDDGDGVSVAASVRNRVTAAKAKALGKSTKSKKVQASTKMSGKKVANLVISNMAKLR